jgi:hypothetical protein
VGVKRGSSRDVTAPCWESRRYVPRPRHESGLGRCRKRGGRRDLSVGVSVALPVNLHSQGYEAELEPTNVIVLHHTSHVRSVTSCAADDK